MMSAIRIAGCVAALLAATVSAKAEYPDKSIRMVLHVSPGGGTDVMARKLGNALQGILGQTLVIDNRAGGRGASQMAELRMAKPDGYTIGSVTNTHIATFHQTLRQYNVDSVDWIAKLVSEPYLIVVQNDSPIKSLRDLMDTIKAEPGKTHLNYGVLNLGPSPLPGGKIVFVSNRNAFRPPKHPSPCLQLFVMDEDGKNVECIGHLNLGMALHPEH